MTRIPNSRNRAGQNWLGSYRFYRLAVACALTLLVGLTCDAPPTNPDGNGGGSDGNGGDGDVPTAQKADCLGCHTNETMLKAVARDEPPPAEDTGEG